MSRRSHHAVKLANQATAHELLHKLDANIGTPRSGVRHTQVPWRDGVAWLEVLTTRTLSTVMREWVWDLFERNMRSLYEAQQDGYDAQEKRKEIFHPDSRFLVLWPASPAASVSANSDKLEPKPLGYCIFRFDVEETASEDDDELCDVAYCYELQVEAAEQGSGVGRVLMDSLERLALACKMDKVMLTVFKANQQALAVYDKLGFTEDEVDPGRFGMLDVDYSILSKTVTAST